MKKYGISALLVLLLMLIIPVSASADVIFPAPEPFVAGSQVNHLLASLDPGGTVSTNSGLLPQGLFLVTEETEAGVNVYLRGIPTVPGVYDLLFSYNGAESVCTVTVVAPSEPEPVSLSVDSLPLKTSYIVGEELDPAGLRLLVKWSNGESSPVDQGFVCSPTLLDLEGTVEIQVDFQGLLCSFPVEVAPVPEVIESIGVLTLPEKVVYDLGEELDPSGLSIRLYTNYGPRDLPWDEELLCAPTLLTDPGAQEITVFYGEQSCVFTVQVLEPEAPARIAVFHMPDKVDFMLGDPLETDGLVLIETSNRDNPSYVTGGYFCKPKVLEEPGRQEITVTYGDLSCTYYVTVHAAPAVSEPSAAPATIAPIPAASAPADPAAVQTQPELLPSRSPEPQARSGGHLAVILVSASLAALAVLALYVLVINRSVKQYLLDTVRDLFRPRR